MKPKLPRSLQVLPYFIFLGSIPIYRKGLFTEQGYCSCIHDLFQIKLHDLPSFDFIKPDLHFAAKSFKFDLIKLLGAQNEVGDKCSRIRIFTGGHFGFHDFCCFA